MTDVVELTRELVRLDTAGAGEERAALLVGAILESAGARLQYDSFSPGRSTLVAHAGDTSDSPLVLSGHLDTVPADPSLWVHGPLSADSANGRVYGRGSSDMKSGVAALVTALERHLKRGVPARGILLILSAAEETGCEGVAHLVDHLSLPGGGPMLIAEPTSNRVTTGHKGAFWLRASATGRSAHGSRPDLGVSAITPLARLAVRLAEEGLPGVHHVMGTTTASVGTFTGGIQTNLVPDAASMTIDIRLVPGVGSAEILAHMQALAGPEVELQVLLDRAPVYSEPNAPLAALAKEIAGTESRSPLSYFTDASVLSEALGCTETVFLGPGNPDAAHTTNESCPIERIERASEMYEEILARFV